MVQQEGCRCLHSADIRRCRWGEREAYSTIDAILQHLKARPMRIQCASPSRDPVALTRKLASGMQGQIRAHGIRAELQRFEELHTWRGARKTFEGDGTLRSASAIQKESGEGSSSPSPYSSAEVIWFRLYSRGRSRLSPSNRTAEKGSRTWQWRKGQIEGQTTKARPQKSTGCSDMRIVLKMRSRREQDEIKMRSR